MENNKEESLESALVTNIKRMKEQGETGYQREVVIPIPMQAFEKDPRVRSFIRKAGELRRDIKSNMEAEIEQEEVQGLTFINLVIRVNRDTDLERVKEIMEV